MKKIIALVVFSFIALAMLIGYITGQGYVTPAFGGLAVVGLFGLYVGFGILAVIYRLIFRNDPPN